MNPFRRTVPHGFVQLILKAGLTLALFLLLRQTVMAPVWVAGGAVLLSMWALSARPRAETEFGLTPLMAATSAAVAQMVLMQVLLLAVSEPTAVVVSVLATIGGEWMLSPAAAVTVSHA